MKIGILTYHRSHNYGALLQAYALKEFLNKQGYRDVEFIDYFPDYHIQMYANIKPKEFGLLPYKKKIKYPFYLIFKYYPLYRTREKRRKSFNRFIKKYLIKKNEGIKNINYDVVIYGSDQIWRKQKKNECPGFNEIYFGDKKIKAKKRMAFSASMGEIEIDSKDVIFLNRSLKRFSAISVRENDLFNLVKDIAECPMEHTLDPVFLLGKKEWDDIIPQKLIKGKYLLFYNFLENAAILDIVEFISSKTGLIVIELIGKINKREYTPNSRIYDGPENFLSLIKYADFIVTSSFHGVALSIIFEKQFYACLSYKVQRVFSLLSIFGIGERLIDSVQDINLQNLINYDDLSCFVKQERQKSIQFLCDNIS
ncbi:MAG: polysaccharide pyruvyl transferase family protein [Enterococcus sp.]|nr:polysaccharide pyruvyl transferase family protein [Enterococcus sp.]